MFYIHCNCWYFCRRKWRTRTTRHPGTALPSAWAGQTSWEENGVRNAERECNLHAPLVFSATGGAGPAATTLLRRLANKVSEKRSSSYSQTLGWIRCLLSFVPLRARLLCLRGWTELKALDKPELRQPGLAMVEACVSLAPKRKLIIINKIK